MKRRIHLEAWSHFVHGTQALLDNQLPQAITAFCAALSRDPLLAEARHNLAVALRSQGALDQALQAAQSACLCPPRRSQTHTLLGSCWQLKGHLPEAIQAYRQALALDPGCRSAHACLAIASQLDGQGPGAVQRHFEAALEPKPDNPLPALLRARLLGQQYDAIACAREVGARLISELCSVPLITEIMTPETVLGARLPVRRAETADTPVFSGEPQVVLAEEAAALLVGKKIVALTGAGLSSASGLRTRKELWQDFCRDDAVSIWRFHSNPLYLWDVIRDFLGDAIHAPNAAHLALNELEPAKIVTQNVDRLHQRCSPRPPVIELHGALDTVRCHTCGRLGFIERNHILRVRDLLGGRQGWPPKCPRPECEGILRPEVVLFGERVEEKRFAQAITAISSCDVLLVVGCAMDVAPASEFPRLAARCGAAVIECKRNASRISPALATHLLLGPAEETLPALVAALKRLRTP